jgi:hypothetical protein
MDGAEFARAIEPVTYLLGVVSIFAIAPVVVLLGILRFRARERERLYDLLKHLQETNQPLSPEIIRHIMIGPPPTREGDFRRGLLMLAGGIGLAVAYVATVVLSWGPRGAGDTPEEMAALIVVGAILVCVGWVYLILARRKPAA